MKVRFHTMGKSPHSWTYVTQSLARAMLNIGNNEVFYKSTDGLENFPDDLKHILIPGYHGILGANKDSQNSTSDGSVDYMTEDRQIIKVTKDNILPEIPDKNMPYDLDFAYTIFYQAPRRFHPSSKMKALIWNFESSIIPYGWHLYHRAIDYILPSSQFSYDIFANCGVPKDKMLVVPHGVDSKLFNPNIPPFQLKTQKKVKFLHNAIPHARKCHDRVLKGYLDAFTGDDDVCLVMKTKFLTPSQPFEVDVKKIIEEALKGRRNPAEIEVINDFLPTIGALYTATDAVISMSSTEGFCLLPGTIVDIQEKLINIEEVEENNFVTSHTGNQNRVSGVTKRQYCGEIVSIKRHGCSEWFSGTPEHPHLIIKRNKRKFEKLRKDIGMGEIPKWIKLSEIEKGDLVCIPKPKFNTYEEKKEIKLTDYFPDIKIENGNGFLSLSFVQDKDVTSLKDIAKEFNCSFQYVSDLINKKAKGRSDLGAKILNRVEELNYKAPRHICLPEKIKITKELAEFFGTYIAEGSIGTNGGAFEISQHKDEIYSHKLQKNIFEKLNLKYNHKIFGNRSKIIVSGRIFCKILSDLFGKGFFNKKIPKEFYNSRFISYILKGIFYGDGTATNGRYSFSTSSPYLAKDIFEILLEKGIFCNIRLDKRKKNINYCIEVSKSYNEKFYKLINPIKYNNDVFIPAGQKNNSIIEDESFFYVPIANVVKKQYSGFVYNLHVEKDESYTSYGMVTHNCLPLLEALACDSLIIAPRHGGQLEFLNDSNSLLVNAGEMIAPQSMQYWHYAEKAVVGDPSVKHFSELLRRTYENIDYEKNRIKEAARKTTEQFSWENAAKMILDLPIPKALSTARLNYPKRKVLYIVPYAMAGGGEVWVREMIKKLDRNIYEPHVAFVHGMTAELKRMFEGVDFTIEDLGEQGKANALKCMLESENYSIIHFYNSFGMYNLLKECWRQGMRVRIVETVHSDLAWPDAMVKVAKREDLVCAIAPVSNTMAKKMLKYGNKNVMTIPHAINWNKFETVNRSKDVLKEFGVPDGFVIGFVGRLSPEKNIPCVLQCAKNLPQHSFVIVGGGPQEGPLKQMAKELKNVFFIGERQDVEKFYAAFDVLMLSSSMEGLPLVILEAMVTGTPVVASDVGAVSELVTDGINGYTIWNHNDSGLFSAAITRLTNENIWKQMSMNSKLIARAAKERSEEININTLYNKLF